jgi:hypothetical protein
MGIVHSIIGRRQQPQPTKPENDDQRRRRQREEQQIRRPVPPPRQPNELRRTRSEGDFRRPAMPLSGVSAAYSAPPELVESPDEQLYEEETDDWAGVPESRDAVNARAANMPEHQTFRGQTTQLDAPNRPLGYAAHPQHKQWPLDKIVRESNNYRLVKRLTRNLLVATPDANRALSPDTPPATGPTRLLHHDEEADIAARITHGIRHGYGFPGDRVIIHNVHIGNEFDDFHIVSTTSHTETPFEDWDIADIPAQYTGGGGNHPFSIIYRLRFPLPEGYNAFKLCYQGAKERNKVNAPLLVPIRI